MSGINSINSAFNAAQSPYSAGQKAKLGNFEINSKQFGPVAASVIGAADLASDAASAVYSFSSESLRQLGQGADAAYDAIGQAVDQLGELDDLAIEATMALVDGAGELVDTIVEPVATAAQAVGDAVSDTVEELGSALGSVAGYATLGLLAGKQVLDELV